MILFLCRFLGLAVGAVAENRQLVGSDFETGLALDLSGQAGQGTLADIDCPAAFEAYQLMVVQGGRLIAGDAVRVDQAADHLLLRQQLQIAVDGGQGDRGQRLPGQGQYLLRAQRLSTVVQRCENQGFLPGLALRALSQSDRLLRPG